MSGRTRERQPLPELGLREPDSEQAIILDRDQELEPVDVFPWFDDPELSREDPTSS